MLEIINGEPRISHIVIANESQNLEKSVKNTITKYIKDFESFGSVHFENAPRKDGNIGGDQPKIYFLNESQSTLLMTYLRNNEIVRNFKVRLVLEFFRMRELLQNKQSQIVKPQPQNPQLPEIGNSTQKMIELKNDVLETSNLIEILESKKLTTLYRLDKFYRKFHNFSPLENFEIDLENQFFLPTELGKMINKSPVEINLMLEHKGFQVRENGAWKMTSSGNEFGILIIGKYNQIKWKMKTVL